MVPLQSISKYFILGYCIVAAADVNADGAAAITIIHIYAAEATFLAYIDNLKSISFERKSYINNTILYVATMMKMMVMMVMAVYIIGWHTFKIGVHVENASIPLKENAVSWKFYQHLMYNGFGFSCVTGPKPKRPSNEKDNNRRKKTVYIVDLGKFMVTDSDIGPLTYVRRYFCRKKNAMFTHSFLKA